MIPIIPMPNGTTNVSKKTVSLPQDLAVDLGSFDKWVLEAFCERTGCTLTEGKPWLCLCRDATIPQEGYHLTVTEEGATLSASGEAGVIYGLTSLYQLAVDHTVPQCDIVDHPRYGYRGLSFDCARHFFPASHVKQVIEELSMVKMNALHWHLTDDQAFRIESKRFPKLQETSGQYYTQEEIRDIVEYARVRGVEIIPEIDLPGHTTGILAAFPQFGCFGKEVNLATTGGIFSVILCAGKEDTFTFLEALLEEVCALFPSKRFHIGGDEAPKTEWAKCPHCKQRMEQLGLTEVEDLQGYFTERVAEILKKQGKSIVCWNDSLRAKNLPEDVLIQYWTMQHLEAMERYTGKFIFSEMFDLYLDYPYSMTSLKKVYTCQPKIGKADCADAPGMEGMECCVWSERIETPEQMGKRLFPRVYALAEAAWSEKRNYSSFRKRLPALVARAEKAGVSCTEKSWWDPRGKARREEGIAYLKAMTANIPAEAMPETEQSGGNAMMLALITKFFKITDIPYVIKAFKK